MKRRGTAFMVFLSIVLISSSCVSRKKITYLQYSNKETDFNAFSTENRTSVTPASYRIMPFDNLFIRVITPDPQWSALFNVMPVGAGGAVTEESAGLLGYPVDINGNIEIPYVGPLEVAGKTLFEIKEELENVFRNYVNDASITVRLVNNYISILGEVGAPGRYRLTKDRINIFEAISLSGDITLFGNRQKVMLIRPSPYGPVVKEFTIGDRSILSSEFFYVMPNDIIYAPPMHARSFQANSAFWSLFLNTLTSVLGVWAFFRTL